MTFIFLTGVVVFPEVAFALPFRVFGLFDVGHVPPDDNKDDDPVDADDDDPVDTDDDVPVDTDDDDPVDTDDDDPVDSVDGS